jgi:hypothetical protein
MRLLFVVVLVRQLEYMSKYSKPKTKEKEGKEREE